MKELVVRMEDSGQLTPIVELVRCKDCEYRGNPKKCILAKHISMLPDRGLVDLINTSEWFCADGKPKAGDGDG